jgi:hypothetical protein
MIADWSAPKWVSWVALIVAGGLAIFGFRFTANDDEWIANVGLDSKLFGTHSLRRTKATLIYRRTGNLRAVQLLLIAGCSPAILIRVGCSSGMNLTSPQVAKSPILRLEPFSSRPVTGQRSKNSYA